MNFGRNFVRVSHSQSQEKGELEKALIGYFLPEGLLEHFKITNIEELGGVSNRRIEASNWSEIQEQRAKLLF